MKKSITQDMTSHPPGFFLPDESSAGKALVCKPFSSFPAGTSFITAAPTTYRCAPSSGFLLPSPFSNFFDKLTADTQLSGGFLKKGLYIPYAVGKAVCKFKTVVGLNAFHTDASV